MTTIDSRADNNKRESLARNLDLVILVSVIVIDVRLFSGSSVASFTLFEIYIWGYCAPYVLANFIFVRNHGSKDCGKFMSALLLYLVWILISSLFAVLFKNDLLVLQDAKSILPVVILASFLLYRIRNMNQVVLICNLYIVYSLCSCFLGFSQHMYGGPYLRELKAGTEYKVDLQGATIANPMAGFSGHPNEFAMAILPALCLAALKLHAEITSGWRIRLTTLSVTVILLAGIIISQAKGAILFTAAAIFYFLIPIKELRRRFLPKFVWTVVVIMCTVFFGLQQATSGNAAGSETIETRYLLWETSFKSVGADSYVLFFGDGVKFVEKWSEQISGWQFPDAHNGWIDQMLFFGLPAVFFYFMIWFRFFQVVDKYVSSTGDGNQVLLDGIRAAILALMGDYFFEPVAIEVFLLSQLFLFMSLGILVVRLNTSDDRTVVRVAGARYRADRAGDGMDDARTASNAGVG